MTCGYIVGVARYTDVTVRYVPRFGGHSSIRFRYNMNKKEIYYALFLLILKTVVQIKKNPSRCENTTYYYVIYIKSVLFSQIKADLYTVIINKTISV